MKPGLETIRRLCQLLGNPQDSFESVLIAGTNGKGSVARYLAAAVQASGHRTGLFTSPHLVRIEERITVNGESIRSGPFARALTSVVEQIEKNALEPEPTFFEVLTATAFLHFQRSAVRLAVLEVGMGGRLDSTNIVEPVLSVLTPISLDHQQYLGSTIAEMVYEKGGILRPGFPAISARQSPEAEALLDEKAREVGTELTYVQTPEEVVTDQRGRFSFRYDGLDFALQAVGRCQMENAVLAFEASGVLSKGGVVVDRQWTSRAIQSTVPAGVLNWIEGQPPMLLDGAHNVEAARRLAEYVREFVPASRTLIFGMMADKDISGVAEYLAPLFENVVLAPVSSPRALLTWEMKEHFPSAVEAPSVEIALEMVTAAAPTVVVSGSLYLVGEVMALLGQRWDRNESDWIC